MVELFAKAHDLPVSWVGGVRPGSFHEDAVDGVTWADARFDPTRIADQVAFQDGGGNGVFVETAGVWHYAKAAVSNGCAVGLPKSVNRAWGLDTPSSCSAEGSEAHESSQAVSGVGPIAASQVGVLTNPQSSSFSYDCDPYTTIEGGGATGCGVDSTVNNPNGTTTTVETENQEWCASFAKWVWSWAGQPDTGVLNADASSFYTWGQDNGDTLTVDGTNAQVGDAVVLYSSSVTPGPGVYADHVGIIVGVSGSSVTTVNGDFYISAGQTIGVYEQTNSSLAQYASAAEGSGEQWVLVAPSGSTSPPPPLQSVSAVLQSNGDQNVYYVGSNGQMFNWYYLPASGWSDAQLGNSETVEAGTSISAVLDPDGYENVYYVGSNGQLWNWYSTSSGWSDVQLGNGVSANAYSGVSGVIQSNGDQNVYYVGSNGQMFNWYYLPASGWSDAQLVDAPSQAPSITSTPSTSFTIGSPGSFTITSIGTPTPSLTESGSLPSGVTFTDNGNDTATLSGTPAAGTVGSYPITITASNGVSPDATQDFTLTVTGLATTTTPTVNPSSVSHGSKVTYKATVSSSRAPTGTVSFAVGSRTLCTATLKSETATCKSGKAPTGSDTVTATYSGDSTFAPSTGTTHLTVTRITTATAARVHPISATKGQNVTYSATVTSKEGTPGGSVVFTIGSKTMCTATLKSGTAKCTSTKAPTGSDTVKATYKGTTNYATSVGRTKLDVMS
jgi:hypothetical protein